MINTRDIYSLTEFQRKTREHIARLKETGRPSVLTVNGKAELVVQDAEAYQEMLDVLEEAEAIIGIQRGLDAVARGDTMSVEEAFAGIRARARARAEG